MKNERRNLIVLVLEIALIVGLHVAKLNHDEKAREGIAQSKEIRSEPKIPISPFTLTVLK